MTEPVSSSSARVALGGGMKIWVWKEDPGAVPRGTRADGVVIVG